MATRNLEHLTVHALSWLVAGNAIGLLLATLLLAPELNGWIAPLSYGRWMPLHLDAQLYGWCGLGLVAILFKLFLSREDTARGPRLAVDVWSGTLLFACLLWLAGQSSGKLFLEWSGASRLLLAGNLSLLWVVLALAFRRRVADGSVRRWGVVGRAALLASLLPLPALLYWVSGPAVYPAVNPDSGGPTGVSLLGSSLGAVAIFLICPPAIGLRPRRGWRRVAAPPLALLLHFGVFLLLDHGNRSHREWIEIVALASVLVWLPLLFVYLREFDWPPPARRWLGALCAWGALLVCSGFATFIPTLLDRWKFTNALVGHAHLALAGMATSFVALALATVNERPRMARLLATRRPFALWHAGCALHVVALLALGTIESAESGVMFRADAVVQSLYGLRWVAGLAMLWASISWLSAASRALHAAEARPTLGSLREAA